MNIDFEEQLCQIPLEQLVKMRLDSMLRSMEGIETPLMNMVLEHVERAMLTSALELCRGNSRKAAAMLGIHRNTLRSKSRLLGLKPMGYRMKSPQET